MIEKITDLVIVRLTGYSDFVFVLALITAGSVFWAILERRRANKASQESAKLMLEIIKDQREDIRQMDASLRLHAKAARRVGQMYEWRAEALRRGADLPETD